MKTLAEAIRGLRSNPGSLAGFALEYSAVAGRKYGSIPEFETRLRVDGAGSCTLFRRRDDGDTAICPPGLFEGSLGAEKSQALLAALENSSPESLRTGAPSPRDTISTLEVTLDGRPFSFHWGPIAPPVPAGMANLRRILFDFVASACPRPIWSLDLGVISQAVDGNRLRARLRIENKGAVPIHLIHPASPHGQPGIRLEFQYGEKQVFEEDVTPSPMSLEIAAVSLPALDSTRLVSVSPGQPLELDAQADLDLDGEDDSGWLGGFSFHHYVGKETLAGQPVFNGALFSEEITW